MEQKKLEKIQHNISVMEEHIADAITGEYPLSLDDLARHIETHKKKEQKQLKIVQQKETDLQDSNVTSTDWENIKSRIPTWQDLFLHADTPTKRVLIHKLIERIVITRERIVIRFKIRLDNFRCTSSRMNEHGVVPEQGL